MIKNVQVNTERRPLPVICLQELSARQRAPALRTGSCSLMPVPSSAASSLHTRWKLQSLSGSRTYKGHPGNINLYLEIRVKILICPKGE